MVQIPARELDGAFLRPGQNPLHKDGGRVCNGVGKVFESGAGCEMDQPTSEGGPGQLRRSDRCKGLQLSSKQIPRTRQLCRWREVDNSQVDNSQVDKSYTYKSNYGDKVTTLFKFTSPTMNKSTTLQVDKYTV